jgi:hypothetical protein
MTAIEVTRLINSIREFQNNNIPKAEAEWSSSKNGFKYEVIHNGDVCVFEVTKVGDERLAKIKVGDYKAIHSEGTELYTLISEFAIWM